MYGIGNSLALTGHNAHVICSVAAPIVFLPGGRQITGWWPRQPHQLLADLHEPEPTPGDATTRTTEAPCSTGHCSDWVLLKVLNIITFCQAICWSSCRVLKVELAANHLFANAIFLPSLTRITVHVMHRNGRVLLWPRHVNTIVQNTCTAQQIYTHM